MAPRSDSRNDVLYAQLKRRIVEYGEWDRLSSLLVEKLNESGWLDDFRHRSKEMARNMDTPNFEVLVSELGPQAETSVSPTIKQEMSTRIRQYLEKHIEG
ncbi:hypothetical protein AcW1_003059 [Taiwanofungus camphoratus]|nr:hypothetical protein AcV5_001750 [Antrodia cinnamomea]KAI0933327.1 hypothetical protein AcV7_004830 [Antrodia cinnamomea]KAI0942426.1 hypothetical protein AcW1_003059 [Antrodia cinnamomea]